MALESAREIVAKEGVAALSARKVSKSIGYASGTLYQIFDGMDDLVETMNAMTLAALYDHCRAGAQHGGVAAQLRAFSMLFIEFVKEHPNEWDAIMSYRYKDDHTTSDAYATEIQRLFGLMQSATRQFYSENEGDQHATEMALLWASLTGILGIASSERQVGGTLEEMIDQLIRMYLKSHGETK